MVALKAECAVAVRDAHLLHGVDDNEPDAVLTSHEVVQLVYEAVDDASLVEREVEVLARRVGQLPHAASEPRPISWCR